MAKPAVKHPLFARGYAWLARKEDEAGNFENRKELLAGLSGRIVEVGSGIKSGKQGAQLYDRDVKKQAQQLGLPGW